MSSPYFITGLPRCRSAWLANWLTWGESLCLHDALQHYGSFDAFCEGLDHLPASRVGHSDPANIFIWRRLAERYPEAKWIVIHRDFEKTYQACKQALGWFSREPLWRMADELRELIHTLKPTELDFDDDMLGPKVSAALRLGWSTQRHALLNHMQVQIEPRWLKAQIAHLSTTDHWLKEAA